MEVLNALVPEKLLTFILALVMSVNMSGCYNKAGAESGVTETTQTETTVITSETSVTTTAKSNNIFEDIPDYLPDGMSMDDLLSGLQINGITIKLPTTFNEITALDDKFSYKLLRPDLFNSYEESFDMLGNVSFSLLYNDIKIARVAIRKDYYTGNINDSLIYTIDMMNKESFDEAGVSFRLFSDISFDSNYDDFVSCLGVPTDESGYNGYTGSPGIEYTFRKEKFVYVLHVYTQKDFNISKANNGIISINIYTYEVKYE